MRARRPSLRTEPAPAPSLATARAVAAMLALALAVRLVPLAAASNWLWGVDALRWRPLPEALALAALALLGWIPPVGRALDRALETLGALWERGGRLADLAVAAAGGVALDLLRDPLRWPGDALLRATMVRSPHLSEALLAQSYPLERLLDVELPRWLVARGLTVEGALQLVGALVGGAFLFAAARFLRACGARGAALPAGLLALAGGGLLVHFAGYDKFGPLAVGIALTSLGAVRLARDGRGAWTLAAGAIVAVLAHRSAYLLAPALAWTAARAWSTAADRRARVALAAAAALAIVAFVVMLPRTVDLALHYDRPVHLPGGAVAGSKAARGEMDALVRLADALNVLAWLVPLGWAGAVAAAQARRAGAWRFSPLAPALLALVAMAAIPLGVEPGGGWAKDWDVAVGAGALAACAGAGALVTFWAAPRGRPTLAPAVALALAVMLSTWALHVDGAAAERRVETLLAAHPAWRGAVRTQSFDFLAAQAFNHGEYARAATLFDRAIAAGGPNPRLLFESGRAHLEGGALDTAGTRFRATVALAPDNAQAWSGLAFVALKHDSGAAARACVDSALAHDPRLPSARAIARILDQAGVP